MRFHLITNCTNSKNSKALNKFYFSDFKNNKNVVSSWLNALNNGKAGIKAIDMYVGDHWSNVRKIYDLGIPVSIVSAGYGLLSSEHLIHSYDATFSPRSENSVGQIFESNYLAERNIKWWESINKSLLGLPPLRSLINENSTAFFIIALAPHYLKVIEPELIELTSSNKVNRQNTIIISREAKIHDSLKEMFYRNSEDFCDVLGGNRVSLNIRLARYLLDQADKSTDVVEHISKRYEKLLLEAKPAKKYKRKKLSDDEIIEFIQRELKDSKGLTPSASGFLRSLRNKGLACEQKRFGSIYRSVLCKSVMETL